MTAPSPDDPARRPAARNLRLAAASVGAVALIAVVFLSVRALNPTPAANGSSLSESEMDALVARLKDITALVLADKADEALVRLEPLMEKHPGQPEVLAVWVEVQLSLNEPEIAYPVMLELMLHRKDDAELRFDAGVVASLLGRIDEAAEHFQWACRLDPRNPKHPLYLAQMFIKLHDYAQARTHLVRVTVLDDSIHEAWGNLGELALIENRPEMALQHVRKARELDPEYLHWRLVEARALRRLNRAEEALTLLNALSDPVERYSPEVVDELALCWALMGRPEKAAEEYIAWANENPEIALPPAKAAEYFHKAGDESKARLWLGIAQRIDAEDATVKSVAATINSGG